MPIVGGLDIHRKQLTFDYLDTVTGEVAARPTAPADREHLRAWLARFAGRGDVAFAVEGCTGWRMSPRSWPRPGSPPIWASLLDTAAALRPQAARQDRQNRLPAPQDAAGRGPAAGVLDPAAQTRSTGRCWRPTTICAASTPPGVQRIHAVFFHQGAPALGEGALRTEQSLAALRAAAAAHLSPGGSCRSPPPWTCSPPSRPGWARCATSCVMPPGISLARRCWSRGCMGSPNHRTGADLLAGRGRPVLLLPQGCLVHRTGHHRLVFGPQRPARAPVPARTAHAALGGL